MFGKMLWLLTGEYPHSGGLHGGIVFDDERRLFRSFSKAGHARGFVTVTARFACHGVGFARGSAALRREPRSADTASARSIEEHESAEGYEVVTGSFRLRTSFGSGRFVSVRSEGAFPRGAGSEASSDGVRRIYASVPVELAGKFPFVGIVAFVDFVSVETQDASFSVRCGRHVGDGGVYEDVASFLAVLFISEDHDGEHRISVRVVRVGIDVGVSPLDDDGFLSGNRECAVIGSSGYRASLDGKVAAGVAINRRSVR